MFDEPLLGIAPKAFKSIYIYSTTRKVFPVIDLQMTIPTEHQGIVDLIFIGIDDASAAHLGYCKAHNRSRLNVRQSLGPNTSIALKYPKYRHFAGCTASPLPFSSAAEVRFIKLNFSAKQLGGVVGVSHNRHPQSGHRLQSSAVSNAKLKCDLPGRHFKFEKLDQAQPIPATKCATVDPTPAQVMKGVPTAAATPPSVLETIEFFRPAKGTKSLMVFEAKSQHVFSCRRFAFNNALVSS